MTPVRYKIKKLMKDGYPQKQAVAMILMVRLRVLKRDKKRSYKLAERYHTFLGKRTKSKNDLRKKMIFKI